MRLATSTVKKPLASVVAGYVEVGPLDVEHRVRVRGCICLLFGWVEPAQVTWPTRFTATGVSVGVAVFVGVSVRIGVSVKVGVMVGVGLGVEVEVGVGGAGMCQMPK